MNINLKSQNEANWALICILWDNGYCLQERDSGGTGGIAAQGQIYMGTPIGIVKIQLQLEIAAPV